VVTRVLKQVLTDGSHIYKPVVPLADNFPILVQLQKKASALDTLSNSSSQRSLPASYYFTNRNPGAPQTYPLLSRTVPLRDDTQQYEQGELVRDSADQTIKAFFFGQDGSRSWMPVNTTIPLSDAGYVNRTDHSLIPTRFIYTFGAEANVHDVTFVLKNNANATVTSIHQVSDTALGKASLDFTSFVPLVLNTGNSDVPDYYTLEITGDNGFRKTHSIMFCDPALLQSDTWGLVHLQPRVADPRFNLLDNDGLLISRQNPDGLVIPPPVFELRIKSRFAFWRFVNNSNKKIIHNPVLDPLLFYDTGRGMYETKTMVNASYVPREFGSQYLPNPEKDSALRSEMKRIFVDIRVPKSKMFDI
jgi:hypothetical protein